MKTVFAVLTFLFLSSVIHAQNTFPVTGSVGIGTTTPNASSILEINSTTKGILIPRMTKNQRDAIVSPATGLLIYETNNTKGFFYYNGNSWMQLGSAGAGWLTGVGAPSGTLGLTGDLYLDTSTGNYYLKTATATWTLQGNLKGPAGAQGATGPQGLQGATGLQGPAGVNGANGLNGANGANGANGLNGANGVGVLSTIDNHNGTFTVYYSDGSSFTTSNLTGPQGATGAQGPQGDIGPQGPAGANGTNGYLLPGATDGNTPYWNGSQWVLNSSNLFNNGTHIGIGDTSTSAKLNVGGTIKIADGTQGDGKFLKSDANGLASWSDVSFTDVLGSTPTPDFSCLSVIGSATTGSFPNSVTVSGNYAYVVNNASNTLQVFEVTNPATPVLAGSIATAQSPFSVAISGNYAYVSNSEFDTLQVFNVSNPSAPFLAGSVATGGVSPSVAVSGNYAYEVVSPNLLQVFNVSDPSAPFLVGSVATNTTTPYSVAISGNYAYVTSLNPSMLQVFNVTNPATPALVGSINTTKAPYSVAISGNYAYVANLGANNMQVFNVSNPSAPSLAGSVGTGSTPISVAVSGNYAYIANATGSLQVFNVSQPSAPALAGSVATGSNSHWVAVSGNYAYVPNSEFNNLQVVQLSCSIAFNPLTGSTEAIPQVQVWAENGNDIYNLNSGRVGVGTSSPGGQFELSLDEGRKPSTSTWTITSDERLKNIDGDYTKGLKEILQLHPIAYHYKNAGNRTFDAQVLAVQNVGFSAQDVQKIFPEAVGTDDNGYLNFNIHPILIAEVNAFKQLNSKVDSLKQRSASPCNDSLVNALQQQVSTLQQQNVQQKQINSDLNARLDALINQMNNFEVSLSQCCTSFQQQKTKTSDEPVLEQNVPNPFNQTCYIKFYIPSTAKSAMLVISDVNGIVRKEFSGLQPGYGTVNIDYSSMASGAYYYSLIIDEKKFDTKQMILTR